MQRINTIELDNNSFTPDLLRTATFFSYAEGGAMGEPGRVLFVTEDHSVYHSNFCFGELTWETVERAFPVLHEYDSHSRDWKHVYLGFGNHLFVRQDHFETFSQLISECRGPPEVYSCWLKKALSTN